MKNKPDQNCISIIEFRAEKGAVIRVLGFSVEETDSSVVIASTFESNGFTDMTKIDKSRVIKSYRLILKK